MPSTISFNQGDIVLVPFPFTDLSATKQRPAIILSPKRLNNLRSDLVVAAITSQIPDTLSDDEVLLSDADLRAAGSRSAQLLNLVRFYDPPRLNSQEARMHPTIDSGRGFEETAPIIAMTNQRVGGLH